MLPTQVFLLELDVIYFSRSKGIILDQTEVLGQKEQPGKFRDENYYFSVKFEAILACF